MQLLQDGNLNAKQLRQFGTSQLYSLLQKQTPVICKSWPICWRVTAVRRQVASHHNLSNSLVFECSPRQGCQLQLLTSVIVSKNIESNHWATTRILNIYFPQSQSLPSYFRCSVTEPLAVFVHFFGMWVTAIQRPRCCLDQVSNLQHQMSHFSPCCPTMREKGAKHTAGDGFILEPKVSTCETSGLRLNETF